jgi:LPXTG-site transpeptidase (sortase) family protein
VSRKTLSILSVLLITSGVAAVAHYSNLRAEAGRAQSDGIKQFHEMVAREKAKPAAAFASDPVVAPTLVAAAGDSTAETEAVLTEDNLAEDDWDDSDIPLVPTGQISFARPTPPPRPDPKELEEEWLTASAAADTSNWAPNRLKLWKGLMADPPVDPIALMEIPSLDMQVPVYKGATDQNMDLGAGHIGGTTRIGRVGNIGISGHRDGFFRDLQNISKGDDILLRDTRGESRTYVIEDITIVTPQDVSVLLPDDKDRLTLVTCYPFYFVGHAPKRFIVHAVRSTTL